MSTLFKILEAMVLEYGTERVKCSLNLVLSDWNLSTERIDELIVDRGWPIKKLNRIKMVRLLGIESGLKEAKDWVERHYPNQGSTFQKGD